MKALLFILVLLVLGCPGPEPQPYFEEWEKSAESATVTITDFSRTPATVDISGSDASLSCTVTATGSSPIVSDAECTWQSPAGKRLSCVTHSPATGDGTSGTWDCATDIPQGSETGTWRLAWAGLRDAAGDNKFWTGDEIEAFPATVTATVSGGTADTTPPTISAVSVSGAITQAGGGTLTTTITAADAQSGLSSTGVTWCSPDGLDVVSCAQAGDGACAINVPATEQTGVWRVQTVTAKNTVGLVESIDRTAVAALPGDASFTVATSTGTVVLDVDGGAWSGSEFADWTLYPGASTGSGDGSVSVSPGDYAVEWTETLCCEASYNLENNNLSATSVQSVGAGESITFVPTVSRKSLLLAGNLSVNVEPAGAEAATWTVDAPSWPGQFSQAGSGDADITGDLYQTTDYRVTFDAVTGYNTPAPITLTSDFFTPKEFLGTYTVE